MTGPQNQPSPRASRRRRGDRRVHQGGAELFKRNSAIFCFFGRLGYGFDRLPRSNMEAIPGAENAVQDAADGAYRYVSGMQRS